MNRNALKYATNLSCSSFSQRGRISNYWYGLDYYCKIRELVKSFETEGKSFVEKMQKFQRELLSFEKMDLVLSCDEKSYNFLRDEELFGLKDLSRGTIKPWKVSMPLQKTPSQGRVIASHVAFTSVAVPGVSYVHPDAAALSVAAGIFDNKTLHKRIREQGGAYGSGAVNNLNSGKI